MRHRLMVVRRWLFKRRLRKERKWREFLASMQPAPVPEPAPDATAAALQGAAGLIQAFTSAEIERIKSTADDRAAEREQKAKDRERMRELRRENVARRRDPVTGKLTSGNFHAPNAGCKVCRGDVYLTPHDIDRHYAERHQPPAQNGN